MEKIPPGSRLRGVFATVINGPAASTSLANVTSAHNSTAVAPAVLSTVSVS